MNVCNAGKQAAQQFADAVYANTGRIVPVRATESYVLAFVFLNRTLATPILGKWKNYYPTGICTDKK